MSLIRMCVIVLVLASEELDEGRVDVQGLDLPGDEVAHGARDLRLADVQPQRGLGHEGLHPLQRWPLTATDRLRGHLHGQRASRSRAERAAL
jgi:hypothetical protein